jgi:hypothetical protein
MRNRMVLAYLLLVVMMTSCIGGSSDTVNPSPSPDADVPVTLDPSATLEVEPMPEEETTTLEELIAQASGGEVTDFVYPTFDPQNPSAFSSELVGTSAENPFVGVLFDSVSLTFRGGEGDLNYQIEVYPDGRVVQADRQGIISLDEVHALQARFDAINLFAINQVLDGAPFSRSPYYYDFIVRQAGREFNITAQDAYVPPELADIFLTILDYETVLGE